MKLLTLIALTGGILLLSGCASNKPEVEMYLRYNKETGIATGRIEHNGQVTKILMEPEFGMAKHNPDVEVSVD